MSFGAISFGRFSLVEIPKYALADDVNMNTGDRTTTIAGQESVPGIPASTLAARQEDIHGLYSTFVPITFTDKSYRNGYYQVVDANTSVLDWNGEVVTLGWSLRLQHLGSDTELDIESRLTGASYRNNSFGVSATAEHWHAPPIGHYAYWTGTTLPSSMTRTGADGAMTVYRQVPGGVSPRWGCTVGNYPAGRTRFIANSLERTGANFTCAASGWEANNALVRVKPLTSSGVLEVSAYTGGAWQAKNWDLLVGGSSISSWDGCTVLRNEMETVTFRLLKSQSPGRLTCDVILRRGSRFAELYVQAETSSTIKLVRATTEAGTASTGYITATANDGAGNRYIIGSAHTFTGDTSNGGLSVSASTTLDAFIGVVAGGSGAVSGDQAANLWVQYIGTQEELVQAVRR